MVRVSFSVAASDRSIRTAVGIPVFRCLRAGNHTFPAQGVIHR
jgi:hypothetical protein